MFTIPYGLEIFVLLITTICVVFGIKILSFRKKQEYITKFADYSGILKYHMEKAYDLIHKDRLLVYSLEGMRINDDQFNAVTQEFVKLVIKFCGPMLYKEFIKLHGDEDTLVFNMVEYFNSRYEDDEVRRSTLESMSEQESASEE